MRIMMIMDEAGSNVSSGLVGRLSDSGWIMSVQDFSWLAAWKMKECRACACTGSNLDLGTGSGTGNLWPGSAWSGARHGHGTAARAGGREAGMILGGRGTSDRRDIR